MLNIFGKHKHKEEKSTCTHHWVHVGNRLIDTSTCGIVDFENREVLYCPKCSNEINVTKSEMEIKLNSQKAREEFYETNSITN